MEMENTQVVEVEELMEHGPQKKYNNDIALEALIKTDMDDFKSNHYYGQVYLVPYCVNTLGMHPFMQFIMHYTGTYLKNEFNNIIKFYEFLYTPFVDIMENSNKLLNLALLHLTNGNNIHFSKYYKGYINKSDDLYLFYDLTDMNIDSTVTNISHTWILQSCEIIDTYSYNTPISNVVVDLFKEHSYFLYLRDENNELYQLPQVGYSGSTYKQAEFRSVFGNPPLNDDESIFGSHYYFMDYMSAFEEAKSEKNVIGKERKYGGLNRYALFKGKTISFIEFSNKTIEDGLSKDWSENYDSIYLEGLVVLKNYEQQVPVSYHIVV